MLTEQRQFAADSQLKTIDNFAFFNTNLTSVTLPPSLCTICEGAFASCAQLTTVNITPNSSNGCFLVEIGNGAFQGCTALNSVRIPATSASSITFGTTKGIFDASTTVRLYLPNTSTVRRTLNLQTADANMFCNSTLLIYAGRYRLSEYNGTAYVRKLAEKRTTKLSRVYPS